MYFYFKQSRYLESRSKHRFAYYDWPTRIMLRSVEHHQRRLDRLQNCPIGSSPSNCGRVLARFYFGDCLQNVKDQLVFLCFLYFNLSIHRENGRRNVFLEIIFSLTRIVSSVFLLLRITAIIIIQYYYYSSLCIFFHIFIVKHIIRN